MSEAVIETTIPTKSDFIRSQIAADLDAGRYDTVVTRSASVQL